MFCDWTTQAFKNFLINLCSNVCLQPLMLIVPDVQDVYTPLQTDVIVQLSEVSFTLDCKFFNFFLKYICFKCIRLCFSTHLWIIAIGWTFVFCCFWNRKHKRFLFYIFLLEHFLLSFQIFETGKALPLINCTCKTKDKHAHFIITWQENFKKLYKIVFYNVEKTCVTITFSFLKSLSLSAKYEKTP